MQCDTDDALIKVSVYGCLVCITSVLWWHKMLEICISHSGQALVVAWWRSFSFRRTHLFYFSFGWDSARDRQYFDLEYSLHREYR